MAVVFRGNCDSAWRIKEGFEVESRDFVARHG